MAEGYELANIDTVLLKFRITKNFFSKRGIRLLKHDLKYYLCRGVRFYLDFNDDFYDHSSVVFRSLPTQILKLVYSASRK